MYIFSLMSGISLKSAGKGSANGCLRFYTQLKKAIHNFHVARPLTWAYSAEMFMSQQE
jgi:hypothetical protein